ncbi:DoxX family protein [Methylomonas sp. SURF-1]|uniref:DoxX family protein n=1 Tax=Methylomonas aurea TaxID=2952224 RepID=A0ABT1UHC7_9GAMM|nr:DoxX family protein [Methylomonas sp. SURF-1]MCQ8181114.1 DoxX family protein [Methylomonas sp. SURF-1]
MNTLISNPAPDAPGKAANTFLRRLQRLLTPLADVLLRAWVGYAFWISGWLKLNSWDSTLYLFQFEYAVPLLPSPAAAVLATTIELLGPLGLFLGLYARSAAALLFGFNIVAVVSYPELGAAGLEQHRTWGLLLLALMAHGPGRWSVDAWLAQLRRRPG